MAPELYMAILAFLAAIVGLLLLFVDRKDKRTMDTVRALIGAAETFAKMTPSPADDEQIARIKAALFPDETTAPQTAEELDKRLMNNGAEG